nr:TetR/AcrR family transcriptional regulator [Aquicoccus sp. G2-2]MEA1112286.1 TetR/AcrR family transcriptional regulator [Aquicoccus sp. G2-2]
MKQTLEMTSCRSTKDRTLDAAEKNFAAFGFAGASMKAIAADANVAQGLLHYHFDTKENLYREVIARRSACINEARFKMLEKVDTSASDALERVFEAFVTPPFDSGTVRSGYPQMLARMFVGDALDQELVQEHYDVCAERFIDALQNILPEIRRQDLTHCYMAAIGMMLASFPLDGRTERLAGTDDQEPETTERTIAWLVKFCAAGVRAFRN